MLCRLIIEIVAADVQFNQFCELSNEDCRLGSKMIVSSVILMCTS